MIKNVFMPPCGVFLLSIKAHVYLSFCFWLQRLRRLNITTFCYIQSRENQEIHAWLLSSLEIATKFPETTLYVIREATDFR